MKKTAHKRRRRLSLIDAVAGNSTATVERLSVSVFPTDLGWVGLLGHDEKIVSIFVGHSSAKSVLSAAKAKYASIKEADWHPAARGLIEAYAEGEVVDFSSLKIQLPEMTDFRLKVIAATRRLGYGETASYGELARRVGHPGAARAVGTVMSSNRFPILIPCHRVMASGGKLGGFTCPAGTDLKQKMLDLEASALGIRTPRGRRGR